MWEWWSNKLMGLIILILAIVVIGFWFFPSPTRQLLGNFIKNAEPMTDKFLDIGKKLISNFIK